MWLHDVGPLGATVAFAFSTLASSRLINGGGGNPKRNEVSLQFRCSHGIIDHAIVSPSLLIIHDRAFCLVKELRNVGLWGPSMAVAGWTDQDPMQQLGPANTGPLPWASRHLGSPLEFSLTETARSRDSFDEVVPVDLAVKVTYAVMGHPRSSVEDGWHSLVANSTSPRSLRPLDVTNVTPVDRLSRDERPVVRLVNHNITSHDSDVDVDGDADGGVEAFACNILA